MIDYKAREEGGDLRRLSSGIILNKNYSLTWSPVILKILSEPFLTLNLLSPSRNPMHASICSTELYRILREGEIIQNREANPVSITHPA